MTVLLLSMYFSFQTASKSSSEGTTFPRCSQRYQSLLTGEVISAEDIESLAVLIHYFAWIKPVAKDRGVVIENTCSIMEILQRKPCITPPAQDEQAT